MDKPKHVNNRYGDQGTFEFGWVNGVDSLAHDLNAIEFITMDRGVDHQHRTFVNTINDFNWY